MKPLSCKLLQSGENSEEILYIDISFWLQLEMGYWSDPVQ